MALWLSTTVWSLMLYYILLYCYSSKDCLQSVMKRLHHNSKNVQLHSITLLDSCVLNCGKPFHKEVATAEFVKDARAFLGKVCLVVCLAEYILWFIKHKVGCMLNQMFYSYDDGSIVRNV